MAKQPYIQSPLNYIGGKYKILPLNIARYSPVEYEHSSTCFAEDVMQALTFLPIERFSMTIFRI